MEFLLKFVLTIVVLYVLGYFFLKVVLPWMLKRFVRKMQKRMDPNYSEPKKRKAGEINIDFIPESKSTKPEKDNVEYVDYEEIN
jgi:hypothetical protein